jgi:hypothetical protein
LSAILIGSAASVVAVIAALAAYAHPAFAAKSRVTWWFAPCLTLALFAFQWDAIHANFQLWNPDESQMLAGARILTERPVFWRDVDGTSHGPIDQWPLALPRLFGAPIDFSSARIVAAIFTVLLLLCLEFAAAGKVTRNTARLLVLPAWAFFIFNQDPEIAQYTSELIPSFLVVVVAAIMPTALGGGRWSRLVCGTVGLAAGAIPFAKLQGAPLAAWLLAFAAVSLWREPTARHERSRKLVALVIGAALPAIVFVGSATAHGAWADFRVRFIEANFIGYVAQGNVHFNNAPPTPDMIFGLGEFLWPAVLAIVMAAAWRARRQPERPNRAAVVFALGLVATAVFAIYAPRKPFAHYFILLIGPLILLLAALAGPLLDRWRESARRSRLVLIAALALAWLVAPSALHHALHRDYFPIILRARPPVSEPLVAALRKHLSPGERLAVWGWQPALYVETQTISSTADLIVFWQIVPSRWLEFYQQRYLRDLAARPPAVFVDTMGPADFFFHHADAVRHENFPALNAFIQAHYQLAETVDHCRVYVRRS